MNAAVERVVAEMPARGLAVVQPRNLTAADIRQRVNIVQEVMREVMKKDVHYGVIPGCKKPSLWKAGSEVLLATFQIAPSIEVTDLSTDDCIRYQVKVRGMHAPSGTVVGEGIGECSSNEEKYKWRKAYDEEWNSTPETRRRIKYGKYKDKQVRTEPADVANTILKMAKKRAQIDMTLTATSASDCFDQDIEDLPEHLLPEDERPTHDGPPPAHPAQTKPATPYPPESFATNLPKWSELIHQGKKTAAEIIRTAEFKGVLTDEQKKTLTDLEPSE